jgi:acetyl esterase/lipase
MGFSAGGHLASCTGTLFDDPDGKVKGSKWALESG